MLLSILSTLMHFPLPGPIVADKNCEKIHFIGKYCYMFIFIIDIIIIIMHILFKLKAPLFFLCINKYIF
jgi:hypothetical protein